MYYRIINDNDIKVEMNTKRRNEILKFTNMHFYEKP
jgi:hypothetical protein